MPYRFSPVGEVMLTQVLPVYRLICPLEPTANPSLLVRPAMAFTSLVQGAGAPMSPINLVLVASWIMPEVPVPPITTVLEVKVPGVKSATEVCVYC